MRLSRTLVGVVGASLALVALSASPGQVAQARSRAHTLPGGYKHLVVIYEENHSFDNLYGGWGRVNGQRVNGLAQAPDTARTQVAQDGTAYGCLLQNDVNLTAPSPLTSTCHDPAHSVPDSHFPNHPFLIDRYIRPQDKTCPAPGDFTHPNGVPKGEGLPGGCTRDLVHRFYQEQYQIDGGKQDRYVTGSDAVGLSMGHYRTKQLPIYRYLHSKGAPHYVVADRFFQAAFGGSFLNHQWLVAARAPLDTAPKTGMNSVLDSNGFPKAGYPLYTTDPTKVNDGPLTQKCAGTDDSNPVKACGDFAVNTIQPSNWPYAATGEKLPLIDDARYPNIGDRLTDAHVSCNWYSGGWKPAAAGNPGKLFQYHHQPLNYWKDYGPGQPGRSHLKGESDFRAALRDGRLPKVSFVKPYGAENEHPGYASEPDGSDHLVDLLKRISRSPQARSTLVVVTYDEFGGQWDHVPPPSATSKTHGVHDAWGPGTRIPALVLSPSLRRSGVDHTTYDTTSILATIERSFELAPLSSRDAAVHDLRHAVAVGGR